FTETAEPQPEYDNHHIQVYIADFASPYHWLKERGLINMETDAEEWRFQWITDPRDGKKLFQIEHEVRSMKHRLFARPLVNRNHGVTNLNFVPGSDPFRGTY
ncbi:MAG TPA: glyoxalase/bleomycin resistance/dioxygenase family protein, partial [Burkholderiales bacterium]|nr:glyoxalase/bleomycin resistance/dioxygenase family protein [Burkholderiales bacterium]